MSYDLSPLANEVLDTNPNLPTTYANLRPLVQAVSNNHIPEPSRAAVNDVTRELLNYVQRTNR